MPNRALTNRASTPIQPLGLFATQGSPEAIAASVIFSMAAICHSISLCSRRPTMEPAYRRDAMIMNIAGRPGIIIGRFLATLPTGIIRRMGPRRANSRRLVDALSAFAFNAMTRMVEVIPFTEPILQRPESSRRGVAIQMAPPRGRDAMA